MQSETEVLEVCNDCGHRYSHPNDGKKFKCPNCGSPRVMNVRHMDGDDYRLKDEDE